MVLEGFMRAYMYNIWASGTTEEELKTFSTCAEVGGCNRNTAMPDMPKPNKTQSWKDSAAHRELPNQKNGEEREILP